MINSDTLLVASVQVLLRHTLPGVKLLLVFLPADSTRWELVHSLLISMQSAP